jgi:hypothetical protein
MSENNLPPEDLIHIFWPKDEFPPPFPPGCSPEARCEFLRRIAQGVFERRRVELTHELKASQVLERIAWIISKTYAGRGDSFQIADDEALIRISDVLIEHKPHIIRRYVQKQITEEQLLKELRIISGGID